MRTVRTLPSTKFDVVFPPFPIVTFSDEPEVLIVRSALLRAWDAVPPEPVVNGAGKRSFTEPFREFLKKTHGMSEEEHALIPRVPSREVESEWRLELYRR